MMNGSGMGFGWIAWILILVLLVLTIAALTKYLRKEMKELHYDLYNQSNDHRRGNR